MGSMQHTTNTQAELLVVLRGLQIAEEIGLTLLEINTDFTEVIKMLNNENHVFDSVNFECKSIILRLEDVVVKYSYRETNKAADLLAKKGAKKEFFDRLYLTTVHSVFANHAF